MENDPNWHSDTLTQGEVDRLKREDLPSWFEKTSTEEEIRAMKKEEEPKTPRKKLEKIAG